MSGYECCDCGRVINVDVSRCIECQWKMRKAGFCVWCGEKPLKSKQSKYCNECQAKAMEVKFNKEQQEPFRRAYRGSDHRENTRDTKYGARD